MSNDDNQQNPRDHFRSFFQGDGENVDADHEPYHFGIDPSTFMELCETILHQSEGNITEFGVSTAATLLWAAAQPEAFENSIDILEEARFKLGDWSDEDKAKLTAVEIRQIFYGCEKRKDDPEHHEDHFIPIAQVLRIATNRDDPDWHWTKVQSDYDFELVLTGICEEYHTHTCEGHEGHGEHSFIIAGGGKIRRSRIREDYAERFRDAIERRTVESFREELDALFPSTPEEGGSHAEPGTG